jgi:hypothetical protein
MKPDRSNYEIWFIEWLDGNLNPEQVDALKAFLRVNPDLQEEFNDLTQISLEPSDVIFIRKKDLFKPAGSYTEFQFEKMCIASLENDLTPGQVVELKEIVYHDESKRELFELYQKLKLKPLPVSYRGKSTVKRITAGQRILRWSFAVVGAAAAITLLLVLEPLAPSNVKNELQPTAQNITNDTLLIERGAPVINIEQEIPAFNTTARSGRINAIPETRDTEPDMALAEDFDNNKSNSSVDIRRSEALSAVSLTIPEDIIVSTNELIAKELVVYNPGFTTPLTDEKDNEGRGFARFFHKRILKDTTAVTKPVESYDLAKAGITGLNKLLGWDMSLQKNTDENGEIKSYYFSSRLLKFKAPVKKSTNNL